MQCHSLSDVSQLSVKLAFVVQRDSYQAEAEEIACTVLSETVGYKDLQARRITTRYAPPSCLVKTQASAAALHKAQIRSARGHQQSEVYWQQLRLYGPAGKGAADWGSHASHALQAESEA